jgi:hypothetical protein
VRIFHVPFELLLEGGEFCAYDEMHGARRRLPADGKGVSLLFSSDQSGEGGAGETADNGVEPTTHGRFSGGQKSPRSMDGPESPMGLGDSAVSVPQGISSAPPIRWVASCSLPIGVTVEAMAVSMDSRFLSITCSDATVRVYHLSPTIIRPPPLAPVYSDEDMLAVKQQALLEEYAAGEEMRKRDIRNKRLAGKGRHNNALQKTPAVPARVAKMTRACMLFGEYEFEFIDPPREVNPFTVLSPPRPEPVAVVGSITSRPSTVDRPFTPQQQQQHQADTSAGMDSLSTNTATPSPPLKLRCGFHFISTRMHMPLTVDNMIKSMEASNMDLEMLSVDRPRSIAASTTLSRRDSQRMSRASMSSELSPSPSKARFASTSMASVATSSRSPVRNNSSVGGPGSRRSRRSSGTSVNSKSTITKAKDAPPPRLPTNQPGRDGVPVTIGCIYYWSPNENRALLSGNCGPLPGSALDGGNSSHQNVLAALKYVNRLQFNTVEYLKAIALAPPSANAPRPVIPHILRPGRFVSHVPYHITASCVFPELSNYSHLSGLTYDKPLTILGDAQGRVSAWDVNTTVLADASSLSDLPPALRLRSTFESHSNLPSSHPITLSLVAGNPRQVSAVAISHNGRYVASGSLGGQVNISDLRESVAAPLTTPDNESSVGLYKGTLTLPSGDAVHKGARPAFAAHWDGVSRVRCIRFQPDAAIAVAEVVEPLLEISGNPVTPDVMEEDKLAGSALYCYDCDTGQLLCAIRGRTFDPVAHAKSAHSETVEFRGLILNLAQRKLGASIDRESDARLFSPLPAHTLRCYKDDSILTSFWTVSPTGLMLLTGTLKSGTTLVDVINNKVPPPQSSLCFHMLTSASAIREGYPVINQLDHDLTLHAYTTMTPSERIHTTKLETNFEREAMATTLLKQLNIGLGHTSDQDTKQQRLQSRSIEFAPDSRHSRMQKLNTMVSKEFRVISPGSFTQLPASFRPDGYALQLEHRLKRLSSGLLADGVAQSETGSRTAHIFGANVPATSSLHRTSSSSSNIFGSTPRTTHRSSKVPAERSAGGMSSSAASGSGLMSSTNRSAAPQAGQGPSSPMATTRTLVKLGATLTSETPKLYAATVRAATASSPHRVTQRLAQISEGFGKLQGMNFTSALAEKL